MEAEAGGHAQIAAALVAAGAKTAGMQVYRLVLAVESDDAAALAAALAAGADPDGVAPNHVSPVLVACRLGHLSRLEQLREAGARPTAQAVEAACLMERRQIVERLLGHGIRSTGRKSRDKDHLAIARERAKTLGWDEVGPKLKALQQTLS